MSSPAPAEPYGVLLLTYGSPASLGDVPRYVSAVRGGREVSDEAVTEFKRRYSVIGGSPLIGITEAQAAALEARLAGRALVRAAMRFSEPSIAAQLADLRSAGVSRVVGMTMSPQYSPLLMGGYARALDAALAELGAADVTAVMAGAWHTEPAFVAALAGRIEQGLARFADDERASVPLLFTAHSLPRRVAEQEPAYLAQLEETAVAVAEAAGIERARWTFCWQSAGHEPGEWMKPDFAELMPRLAADGHRSVLVVPVQFLADHLEILYDVDIAAREQAEQAGLRFARIASLNDDARLIEAFAQVAQRAVPGAATGRLAEVGN
ncbi:ferrochelatase [soil metagenome]